MPVGTKPSTAVDGSTTERTLSASLNWQTNVCRWVDQNAQVRVNKRCAGLRRAAAQQPPKAGVDP